MAVEIDNKPTMDELDALGNELISKEDLETLLRDRNFKSSALESPIHFDIAEDLADLKRELESMNKTIHTWLGHQD